MGFAYFVCQSISKPSYSIRQFVAVTRRFRYYSAVFPLAILIHLAEFLVLSVDDVICQSQQWNCAISKRFQ